jgi:hypothetical protein
MQIAKGKTLSARIARAKHDSRRRTGLDLQPYVSRHKRMPEWQVLIRISKRYCRKYAGQRFTGCSGARKGYVPRQCVVQQRRGRMIGTCFAAVTGLVQASSDRRPYRELC